MINIINYLRFAAVIFFLKQIISYNDTNFHFTTSLTHYHYPLLFSSFICIYVLMSYNMKSLSLILTIIIIIYLDKYHTYIESFHNKCVNPVKEDTITLGELEKIRRGCTINKWSNKTCKELKEKIIDLCQKKVTSDCPPWRKNHILHNGIKYTVNCPKLFLDIYPSGCLVKKDR